MKSLHPVSESDSIGKNGKEDIMMESGKPELLAKFDQMRRIAEGKSTSSSITSRPRPLAHSSSIQYVSVTGTEPTHEEPQVQIRDAIAFFEGEIARVTFGAGKMKRLKRGRGRKDGQVKGPGGKGGDQA